MFGSERSEHQGSTHAETGSMTKVIEVKRSSVAEAFRNWQGGLRREAGKNRSDKFRSAIEQALTLLGSNDTFHPLPGSKSTWFDWARDEVKSTHLSFDQCRALFTVTGVDVTPNKEITHENDRTSVVTLICDQEAKLVSNEPSDDGLERYQISIERIAFRKSDPMRVTKAWFSDGSAQAEIDLGSAVYGVSRARVTVTADGAITSDLLQLRGNATMVGQYSLGVMVTDNPRENGCWFVDPEIGPVLVGDVGLANFASALSNPDGEVIIKVEVEPDWVEVDFRLSGEAPKSQKQKSDARRHLVNKVLRLALTEPNETLVFSKATVSTNQKL